MRRLPFAITAAVSVSIAVLIIVLWRRKGVDPVKGRITSRYGMRNGKLHNGTDIAVAVGTPVKSPWRGTVSETYTNSAGGKQIIINHPNGYRTGYAHLSEYRVSSGQRVRRGQRESIFLSLSLLQRYITMKKHSFQAYTAPKQITIHLKL